MIERRRDEAYYDRILELEGAGGMREVYRARDVRLNRDVSGRQGNPE